MFGRATDKISSARNALANQAETSLSQSGERKQMPRNIFLLSPGLQLSSERRNGDILLLRRLIATLLPGTVLRAHSRALPLKLLDPVDTRARSLEKYRRMLVF